MQFAKMIKTQLLPSSRVGMILFGEYVRAPPAYLLYDPKGPYLYSQGNAKQHNF